MSVTSCPSLVNKRGTCPVKKTFIILLVAILLSRVLTKPIKELVKATRKIGHGDLNYQVPEGDDELGQLGQAFNTMSRDINAYQASLVSAKETKDKIFVCGAGVV